MSVIDIAIYRARTRGKKGLPAVGIAIAKESVLVSEPLVSLLFNA